jgi:glycosyltransferase involved in cell wall biosynthesis/predicted metal-dependent phosphoesterase TrpH
MIPRIGRGLEGAANGAAVTRVDMHCHSTASAVAKLGIQRSLGLPECATPPEEVYGLAKRRGMDLVTITDHDTIDGCLAIADRPDVFISEELTAWFRGETQAVHILCYGITPDDHLRLQDLARDVEDCAAYLHEREIACALAHPFFAVAAPLGPRHRSRLAELFPVWETRNGSRARELNMPAAVYIETRGGTGVGGSDDHAGVDIGRTWTETPPASTPEELLWHVRQGRARASGEQGSAAKWAHSALALAERALAPEVETPELGTKSRVESVDLPDSQRPNPATAQPEASMSPELVFAIAEQVVTDGGARGGELAGDLGPHHARALLESWRGALDLGSAEGPVSLVALMQADDFSHAELFRRARRTHERRLREAVGKAAGPDAIPSDYPEAMRALFAACVPAVPYVPAATFLGKEKAKLASRDGEPLRAAIVVDAAGSMHGVTHTIERIREHGVPGWEVEVIGTDPRVDRRLPAVAEVEVPFYAGLQVGVPSLPDVCQTLADGRYDLVHLASPGPAGVGAAICARIAGAPLVGSYHTELAAYAGIRTGDPALEAGTRVALGLFYGQCDVVLSPSPASDQSLAGLGIEPHRITRWTRGVDTSLYGPARRDAVPFPGEVRVLYAGRLSKEKGVELLADAFLRARERDPRLHLLLAGGGPDEGWLRERFEQATRDDADEAGHPPATFLGWLDREQLATAYASSDLFLFCSRTDTYGQVIAEAQASGLPVVAVAEGGPLSLIDHGQTGWLCPPDAEMLAGAVCQLASSEFLRERIARGALAASSERGWDSAFEQLANGYERALARAGSHASRWPDRVAA